MSGQLDFNPAGPEGHLVALQRAAETTSLPCEFRGKHHMMKISGEQTRQHRLTTYWIIQTAVRGRRRVEWNKLNNPVITFYSPKSGVCPGEGG